MTVSVIVPTYNGANKILRVLAALEQQTYVPDEVIVVIDGSTDTTAEILRERTFSFPLFKIIEQENQGRAAVRNRGAREAQSELLVFFDDDMRPAPNCLGEHVKHHNQQPNTIAVGYSIEDITQLTNDFQRYKEHLSRKWFTPLAAHAAPSLITGENLFLTAANCSTSKSLFFSLGGFDDVLKDIEDFDLGMRAVEAKVPIFFIRDAFAWHDDFVTCTSYVKRLREYRRAHNVLRLLRPGIYNKYSPAQVNLPSGWKELAFKLFTPRWWRRAIDGNYLRLLPKPLRYKVYDVVTTAQGVYYID